MFFINKCGNGQNGYDSNPSLVFSNGQQYGAPNQNGAVEIEH